MPPGSIEQKNGPPFHRPNRNANGVAGRLLLRNAWFDMVWQRRTLLVNAAIEGYYRSQDFVRWLASPLVNHLSIDSLTTSLRQTRDAVSAVAGRPARIVSCSDASRNSGKAQATAGN